jgi:hypothetical protein
MATITLGYCDLLDILHDFRTNDWEHSPDKIEAFAKYIWEQYETKSK